MSIDLTATYKIEQRVPKGDPIGLSNYGISKLPGTFETICASYDPVTMKYKTGLDPFASEVMILPTEEKVKKQAWIREKVAQLEEKIGRPGILDPTNDDFWSTFSVILEVGEDLKTRIDGKYTEFHPQEIWTHELALILISIDNGFAHSKQDSFDPAYKDTKFFISTTDEIQGFEKVEKKKDRARQVEMSKLFDENGRGFTRAIEIAYYIGAVRDTNIGIDALEEVLEDSTTKGGKLDEFLKACKLDDTEILISNIFKKAVNIGVVRYLKVDNVYHRGGVNYKSTEADSIEYLKTPSMETELQLIKEEVEKSEKRSKKKK